MCESTNLELFLDLGFIPLVDRFLTQKELNEPETLYPLNLRICNDCGLVQLGYIVPAEKLYDKNYAYESGTTTKRRESYLDLANYVSKNFDIPTNSLVVDIGSNVGVLLECFKSNKMKTLGIDPSGNVVKIANSKGIETLEGFFNSEMIKKILSSKPKPHVVTATNLFAHIQNYKLFIEDLKNFLREDGIFVFQVPHFLQLLNNLEYDTVYHEHISYFGLKPLIKFFKKYDMEIFNVLETDIDGGSIRCFVGRIGLHKISNNVNTILEKEENSQINSKEKLEKYANDVKNQKKQLYNLLISLKQDNKRVVGLSAPAKGMTLLNYCKIDNHILDYVTEKSELKIGKYTPGMHIYVEPDQKLLEDKPDYALILAWNFADEIMKNLEDFHKAGGKFILPIPSPKII
jgi:SAM-dependent methyltransferase